MSSSDEEPDTATAGASEDLPVIGDLLPGPAALPRARECVVCFVERMVAAYGCGQRPLWMRVWRSRRAPRATALEHRLHALGGYCDCEIVRNAFVRRERHAARLAAEWTPLELPSGEQPDCLGVRAGSTRGCDAWVIRAREGWWELEVLHEGHVNSTDGPHPCC